MPLSAYSATRDTNADIAPGNIRTEQGDFGSQQVVNAIRQMMADLAGAISPFALTLLDDADAIAARATLGLSWEKISVQTFTNVATVDFTGLAPYRYLRLAYNLLPVTDNVDLLLRYSTDNGASYLAGAAEYNIPHVRTSGGVVTGATTTTSGILPSVALGIGNVSDEGIHGEALFVNFNQAAVARGVGSNFLRTAAGTRTHVTYSFDGTSTVAKNALRILMTSGNLTGGICLDGARG